MSKRLLFILLAGSLALNASFLVGYLHARKAWRDLQTAEGRARWAAGELGLDERQRSAFEGIHRDWRERMRSFRRAHAADLEAVWAGLAADTSGLDTRLETLLAAQRAATLESLDYLRRILRVLTPAQRDALGRLLRSRAGY